MDARALYVSAKAFFVNAAAELVPEKFKRPVGTWKRFTSSPGRFKRTGSKSDLSGQRRLMQMSAFSMNT